jgi:hypothetical protein
MGMDWYSVSEDCPGIASTGVVIQIALLLPSRLGSPPRPPRAPERNHHRPMLPGILHRLPPSLASPHALGGGCKARVPLVVGDIWAAVVVAVLSVSMLMEILDLLLLHVGAGAAIVSRAGLGSRRRHGGRVREGGRVDGRVSMCGRGGGMRRVVVVQNGDEVVGVVPFRRVGVGRAVL